MIAEELIRDLPNIREYAVFNTFIEEGRREGLKLGLSEGRSEGRNEALRAAVHRLGQKRFGQITDDQRESLNAIQTSERLEALIEKVLDAANWDELLRDEKH